MLGRSRTDLEVSTSPVDGFLLVEGDRRWRRSGAEAFGGAPARGASAALLGLGALLRWAGGLPSFSGTLRNSMSWTTFGVDWSSSMVDARRQRASGPCGVARSASMARKRASASSSLLVSVSRSAPLAQERRDGKGQEELLEDQKHEGGAAEAECNGRHGVHGWLWPVAPWSAILYPIL